MKLVPLGSFGGFLFFLVFSFLSLLQIFRLGFLAICFLVLAGAALVLLAWGCSVGEFGLCGVGDFLGLEARMARIKSAGLACRAKCSGDRLYQATKPKHIQ